MERFYRLVVQSSGEDFDPTEAARLEVEWWRAHRELQHDEDGHVDERELVDALTALYSYVYSVPRDRVLTAAQHRAAATVHSDRWVELGRDGRARSSRKSVRSSSAPTRRVAAPSVGEWPQLLVLLAGLVGGVRDIANLLADRLHPARRRGDPVEIDLAQVHVLQRLRQRHAS